MFQFAYIVPLELSGYIYLLLSASYNMLDPVYTDLGGGYVRVDCVLVDITS